MAFQGISFAFDDTALEANPAWTRIDTDYIVQSVSIRRGRRYETDRIDTGRATVTLIDTTGDFDPTYAGAAFANQLVPGKQAGIALRNPTDATWSPLFRGHVQGWYYDFHPTLGFATVTVELVDALAMLSRWELDQDLSYAEDTALDACRTRIVAALDYFSWPGAGNSMDTLREIRSGNVGLQAATYSFRTSMLSIIQDCADAEFPAVANFYAARDGKLTFFGRYSRFQPDDVDYHVDTWYVGDQAAADNDPTATVPLSPPLSFSVDDGMVFNYAIATYKGIESFDIDNQAWLDAASVTAYGSMPWSAEDLLTSNGEGPTTAAAETLLFAEYITSNYATPRVRLGRLTVRPQSEDSTYGDTTWALLCGVELNDIVNVSFTTAWGGGVTGEEGFVEGIEYEIRPMRGDVWDVTLTLDVSPRAWYQTSPFAG